MIDYSPLACVLCGAVASGILERPSGALKIILKQAFPTEYDSAAIDAIVTSVTAEDFDPPKTVVEWNGRISTVLNGGVVCTTTLLKWKRRDTTTSLLRLYKLLLSRTDDAEIKAWFKYDILLRIEAASTVDELNEIWNSIPDSPLVRICGVDPLKHAMADASRNLSIVRGVDLRL